MSEQQGAAPATAATAKELAESILPSPTWSGWPDPASIRLGVRNHEQRVARVAAEIDAYAQRYADARAAEAVGTLRRLHAAMTVPPRVGDWARAPVEWVALLESALATLGAQEGHRGE